jgi:hypothetical protein
LPVAYIEWSDKSETTTKRLTLIIYHPEGFLRERAHMLTESKRAVTPRERLVDFVQVMLYGSYILPSFLSTGCYLFQVSTGTTIPLAAFLDFDADNDTLSQYFNDRPTLNTATMDQPIATKPQPFAKKAAILAVRKAQNIKPADAVAYWRRPHLVARHGSCTVTYELPAQRHIDSTAKSRERTKKRVSELSHGEQEARRLKINSQKNERQSNYTKAAQKN